MTMASDHIGQLSTVRTAVTEGNAHNHAADDR
jgi:hypothetical protein